VMMMAAEICLEGSATLCAVSVTVAGDGSIPGDVVASRVNRAARIRARSRQTGSKVRWYRDDRCSLRLPGRLASRPTRHLQGLATIPA
jgi:hypothetical protein